MKHFRGQIERNRYNIEEFSSYAHHLSHEIRTPLNHIQGFAQLLLMDDDLRASHGDYIRAILDGSATLQAAMLAHLEYVEQATREIN